MSSQPRLDPLPGQDRARRVDRRSVALVQTLPVPQPVRAPERVARAARRIVFVNRFYAPDISATSQLLTDLSRRLAGSGFDVHVVCSRQRYDGPAGSLPENERIQGVHVHRVWSTRFGRGSFMARVADYLSFYPSAAVAAARIARAGDIIVAKTDPPLLSLVLAPVARLRSARLVNWLQDVFPEIAGHLRIPALPRRLLGLLAGLRDRSLRAASMNVVLAEGMRDYLAGRAVPAARLRVVENWAVEEPALAMPVAASGLRQSLELGDRFVVGYSGNLGLSHDYETLLGAVERLRDDHEVVFLLIGGGAGMRALQAKAEARGLRNLRFLPYQPRAGLIDSLAAADVHVVTQLPELEGLMVPSKLYGVMAVGRPVLFVGGADGGVARQLEALECGLAVSCGDSARLAAEILRLKSDAGLRVRLGRNAVAGYFLNHSFDSVVSRWVELLDGVAG